ncbi:MAG: hypothetical protein A3C35_02635 [Omnitrophica bacterium RIFCSPHIGHO2_02_FULL_46_11]|nr:MAG: hypothetical protein A3C35_02635 [Omnitrophica bacterium RIFCSPHIGHO2_02_FULL_46_11]OGW87879.1 MAG: hypothetical protein A3A81_05560 [Omnitrophica bacterium RIFCSPLOWO2_01_FULL_45_10b]
MAPSTERPNLAHPDSSTIRSLFNAISDQYDFLNSFLSFGLEAFWRKQLVREALRGFRCDSILDLGAGTGKSLNIFLKAHSFRYAAGCDFSDRMLQKAKERLGDSAVLVAGDFHELPFPDGSFDLVTGSFILRSVQDMNRFLSEAKRVLRKGGRVVFLELTRPRNPFVWQYVYQPYLKFYIPFSGKLFSRHKNAYQFLSQSIQVFPDPEQLKTDFESAGFKHVSLKPLSFGAVTIIAGTAHE